MENHHFQWNSPLFLVIFQRYVDLPEAKFYTKPSLWAFPPPLLPAVFAAPEPLRIRCGKWNQCDRNGHHRGRCRKRCCHGHPDMNKHPQNHIKSIFWWFPIHLQNQRKQHQHVFRFPCFPSKTHKKIHQNSIKNHQKPIKNPSKIYQKPSTTHHKAIKNYQNPSKTH